MKTFVTIIFLILISSAIAISEYSCMFLAIEPSTLNRALGDITGVVNIWHNSALQSYTNPALPALHEGISYGFTRDQWLEGSGIDDMYYNSAIMTLGYKGIGITLPALNAESKFGTTMDYGSQEQTDENGNSLGTFESYEDAPLFGLAMNTLTLLRDDTEKQSFLNNIDLVIGANYVPIITYLGPGTGQTEIDNDGKAKSHSLNLGLILRAGYNLENYLNLEAVLGASFFNVGKNRIQYFDFGQSDLIYRHQNLGYAVAFEVPSERILQDKLPSAFIFFENLFSVRFLAAELDTYTDDSNITGSGFELGFLDTVFFRNGHYRDVSGHVTGNSKGWGLNLHYKDYVSYTYNSATFPGGDLTDKMKSADHNLSFNLVKIIPLF